MGRPENTGGKGFPRAQRALDRASEFGAHLLLGRWRHGAPAIKLPCRRGDGAQPGIRLVHDHQELGVPGQFGPRRCGVATGAGEVPDLVDEVVDDTPRVRLLRDDDPGQSVHPKQHVWRSRIVDVALSHKPEVIGARRESFPVDQPYQCGQPLVPVGQPLGGHSLTKQPGQLAVGGRGE